jgi:NADH:ubiquinone oxidoreductase subunit H
MRFGFFFFAEYVNVFVVSGLIVTLFFGGWNAPFAWPEAWAIHLNLDPGSMGLGLLVALLIIPPLLILALSAPFYVGRSSLKWWQALIIGFVLFNLLVIVIVGGAAFISWDWVAGLLWFLGKSYVFVFIFVWMRGTLPRVRIDQLMNFAWKWSLLNLFVTAAAVALVARR